MCGIFGIISSAPLGPQRLIELAVANKKRGNLGFGMATGLNGEDGIALRVQKYTGPFNPEMVNYETANVSLGHIRAPTGGQTKTTASIHPFSSSAGLLAHNGLLMNHDQFAHWKPHPAAGIDSQIILGGIQAHLDQNLPVEEAICATVGKLDGQQAFWYWHKPNQTLYVWRVMAPVYIGTDSESLVFSSSKTGLATNLIAQGNLLAIDPTSRTVVKKASFEFYSPYAIGYKLRI